MISNDHYRIVARLEVLQFQGIKAQNFPRRSRVVVDMTFPQLYRPVAVLWLGLSHLLGTVVSKVLLTLVFFGVVTPIGLARKLLGIDSLKLKDFKSGENSVMVIRNHIFTGKDIEKPY